MAEKEYIEREAAYDMDTLYDWYISSVSENDNPVWTEEHLEELLNDFYVIPKDTPAADVAPVRHGHWNTVDKSLMSKTVECTSCNKIFYFAKGQLNVNTMPYCPNCGAKMDGGEQK